MGSNPTVSTFNEWIGVQVFFGCGKIGIMKNHKDLYLKKTIPYSFKGKEFRFDVAHTLFSTFKIDTGSNLLLKTIEVGSPKKILDLGCGYGTLGVVLAGLFPNAKVTMTDKDLLGVKYSRYNCDLNEVSNAEVVGSVGVESVSSEFYDLIVSNIPAKIGDLAIEKEFVLEPLKLLKTGGEYWFVVVSGLNRLIPKIGMRNKLKLNKMKKGEGHTVYRITQ